jgi:hypothetical protein
MGFIARERPGWQERRRRPCPSIVKPARQTRRTVRARPQVALGRPPAASKALAVARATPCGLLVAPEARFRRDADRPAQGHETS